MKKLIPIVTAIASFLLISSTSFAYTGDISINGQDIIFSSSGFLEGRTIRIYVDAINNSNQDLLGIIRFYDNNNQVSADQSISIFAKKTDGVFVDWTPSYGSHRIDVKIFPWIAEIDDPGNNSISTTIFVVQDTDHDGEANSTDSDDDNDTIIDEEDAYPLNSNEQYDTDGDGIGDNADNDDDNDSVPDEFDDLPLDSNETIDTDQDGIGNITDPDDDNDGITDNEEENTGTDPLEADTDKDGTNDREDKFPVDSKEWIDTDNDNIGNNMDIDDDNDGIHDKDDEYPLNKGPIIKLSDKDLTIGLLENHVFDASPSYDEDGKIVSFIWKIDNTKKEGNSISHVFKKLGKHDIKLTIIDDNGESRIAEFQVNVVNLGLYKQITLTILVLLLALIIYFKYIAEAKNPEESHTKS